MQKFQITKKIFFVVRYFERKTAVPPFQCKLFIYSPWINAFIYKAQELGDPFRSYILYVWAFCLYVCLDMTLQAWCQWRSEEGIRSLRTSYRKLWTWVSCGSSARAESTHNLWTPREKIFFVHMLKWALNPPAGCPQEREMAPTYASRLLWTPCVHSGTRTLIN